MPAHDTQGHAPAPAPDRPVTPSPDAAFQADWSRVRVDRLELDRATATSTLARVRACIFLGRLLPVDVHVELVVEGGPDPALPDLMAERMWCEHPYQNGSFEFEAHVSDAAVAVARHISVRICPAGAAHARHALPAVVPTVELQLVPGGPGIARRPVVETPGRMGGSPEADDDLGP